MFQDMLIHINGNKSITIENYRNLLDYKETLLFIQGRQETVKMIGKDFRIDYFTHENMRVTGFLEKIEFQSNSSK